MAAALQISGLSPEMACAGGARKTFLNVACFRPYGRPRVLIAAAIDVLVSTYW